MDRRKEQQKLVLIGGGGHCKSVADAALRMRLFREIVITDPGCPAGNLICGCAVVGDDAVLPELFSKGFRTAIVTVGSLKKTDMRRRLADMAKKIGFSFSNVIDPSAVVSEYARIGDGVFIGKNAVINADAVIEDHVIINTGAIIEHECRVGAFSHVAVGATLCGGVNVSEDVLVGANAMLLQNIKVGERTIIGAGTRVLCDVDSDKRIVDIWKGRSASE